MRDTLVREELERRRAAATAHHEASRDSVSSPIDAACSSSAENGSEDPAVRQRRLAMLQARAWWVAGVPPQAAADEDMQKLLREIPGFQPLTPTQLRTMYLDAVDSVIAQQVDEDIAGTSGSLACDAATDCTRVNWRGTIYCVQNQADYLVSIGSAGKKKKGKAYIANMICKVAAEVEKAGGTPVSIVTDHASSEVSSWASVQAQELHCFTMNLTTKKKHALITSGFRQMVKSRKNA